MALDLIDRINAAAYFNGGNFDNYVTPNVQNVSASGRDQGLTYYDRFDAVYCEGKRSGGGFWGLIFDPLLIDSTSFPFQWFAEVNERYNPAVWNRSAQSQRLFRSPTGSGNSVVNERAPSDPPTTIATDPLNPYLNTTNNYGASIPNDGYYRFADQGGQIHFQDFVLCIRTDAWIGGVGYADVMAAVDIATGFATIQPIPVIHNSVAANIYQAGQFFGANRNFWQGQFIPDEDSIGGAEKGQLMLWDNGINTSGNIYEYGIKFVDFNLTGATGSPNRIHGRERFRSLYTVEGSTVSPSIDNGIPQAAQGVPIFFHAPSQTIRLVSSGTAPIPAGLAAWEAVVLVWKPAAALADLLAPVAVTNVETNRITLFRSEARGDLGERIGGQDIDWTLGRASTEGEVLATTPTPGETVIVEAAVMDDDPASVTVYEDGTPLTITTHYTLTKATGSIHFVGPKPLGGGEVYTADYEHSTVALQPPATGTSLLNSTSRTNEDGEAFARVLIVDDPDLEGQRINVKADSV